jgi:hypothetical protein
MLVCFLNYESKKIHYVLIPNTSTIWQRDFETESSKNSVTFLNPKAKGNRSPTQKSVSPSLCSLQVLWENPKAKTSQIYHQGNLSFSALPHSKKISGKVFFSQLRSARERKNRKREAPPPLTPTASAT